MELLRRLISFVNRPGDALLSTNGASSIPGYYLGHTYTAQPNSDELRRAAHILTAKTKKDIEKNNIPMISCCFEGTFVVLRDGKHHKCAEFEVRKIVVSCVDAKNQRLLAIFYHNESPYISSPVTSRGLECHLFLCRNKEITKFAANKIGELLAKQYDQPQKTNINLDTEQVRVSRVMGANDFDYENVSKFFRQKVFNHEESNYQSRSMFSTPCDSLSTCVTTTGCDSGRASTVASVDIRADEYIRLRTPIHEHDESSDYDDNFEGATNSKVFQNRYSVHYDLEDEETISVDKLQDTKINISNEETDNMKYSVHMNGDELQRLLDLAETDI